MSQTSYGPIDLNFCGQANAVNQPADTAVSPPSSTGSDAHHDDTGMLFDDCLVIIYCLLPGSVSEQETVVKTISSIEQLSKRSFAATRQFRCLKESDLVSSILSKSLSLHKSPVGLDLVGCRPLADREIVRPDKVGFFPY